MRVVHSGDPQGISPAPDFSCFVEEDREPVPLEFQHHFQWIVISKDSPAVRCQCFAEVRHRLRSGNMVTFHTVPVISCEHRRVMRGLFHQIDDHRHECGLQIAVQIGELKKTKSFESGR